MRFEFKVSVEVERTEGKFATRDELSELIMNELEGCDPSSVSCDDGGEYETVDWSVEDVTPARKPSNRKPSTERV